MSFKGVPFRFNLLWFWLYPLPLFNIFFHRHSLLLCKSPWWVSLRGLLLMPNIHPCVCFWRLRVTCVVSVWSTVITVIIFLSLVSVGHCGLFFLLRGCGCTVFSDTFTSFGYVDAASFRLHNLACKSWIWSSCWLNWVYRLLVVVVSSMKVVSHAAVSNAKFMKASSIFSCLTLLLIPYPSAPALCSSSSLSR